jgi:hypothetical protein
MSDGIVVLTLFVSIVGGVFYFIHRYMRVLERRSGDSSKLTEIQARMDALEEAAETTRSDIARLETGQEFTTRLLSIRARSGEGPT